MRSPEIAARGMKMNNMERVKKENIIWVAYCMKAIRLPTCRVDAATSRAPTQMIATLRPVIIRLMSGNIAVNTLPTKRVVLVNSWLALSKRCSSKSCLLKARTTIRPERFSRITRFMRSTSFCIILNFGSASVKASMMNMIKMPTASAINHHIFGLLSMARITPPIPIIGAMKAMRMTIKITCCTWLTSLVVRVIRVEAEKLSNSALEKLETFSKTAARISLATPADVREAR